MSADWCLVIMEAVGILVTTIVLYRVTITLPNSKQELDQNEDRKAKLLSGLAALEKSRRTLLTFKYQYILQRVKYATRLANYINNFTAIESYFNEAGGLYPHPSSADKWECLKEDSKFNSKFVRLINSNPIFTEQNEQVDLSLIKTASNKIYELSQPHIQILYHLIFDNSSLFPTPNNTSYAEKSIPTKDLIEKLYFVANHNPGILIGMAQVTDNFTQLNFMIIQWNEHIKRHQAIKEPTIQDMATHIDYFLSFSYSLYEIGVEGTLMSIKISMDHLLHYARTQFKDHKSFEIYGKSFHEELMPELCDASIKINENLDSMRAK